MTPEAAVFPVLLAQTRKPTPDSSYFLSANCGHKSITVDHEEAEGQEIIRRLANACDVLVENRHTPNRELSAPSLPR